MKKQLFFIGIFCLIIAHSYSQEPAEGIFPLKDSTIYYEKIINIDSANKNEILKRIKFWAVENIVSQKRALETEDKDGNYIIYKMNYSVPFTSPAMKVSFVKIQESKVFWDFYCTLKFELKDFKTKITIINFELEKSSSILNYRANYDKMIADLKLKDMSKKNKENYFIEVKNTFVTANTKAILILNELEKSLKTNIKTDF